MPGKVAPLEGERGRLQAPPLVQLRYDPFGVGLQLDGTSV